jgi:hypothetical protein
MDKKSSAERRRKVAARDPEQGARNRPGFDLGGAVGDAKPRDHSRADSSRVSKATGDLRNPAKSGSGRARKTKSAVAGARDWIRRK